MPEFLGDIVTLDSLVYRVNESREERVRRPESSSLTRAERDTQGESIMGIFSCF
jgi:hypothetical protein